VPLVLRSAKGSRLTTAEMDANLLHVLDSSNSSFLQSGTGAVERDVQDRFRDTVHATDFTGITADGSTTDVFTDLVANMAARTKPVRLIFPAKDYVVASTVDLNLPPGSVVDALGTQFICTHNGVAFDLNPDATDNIPINTTVDTYTKRNITWMGGQFTNTNGTKTASVAIQAYMMRVFRLMNARAGDTSGNGFYAFVKFGGKDTYRFIDCYTFDCTRHYWVPAAGVVFTGSLTGNDLIDVEWRGCNASSSSDEAGVYMETRAVHLRWIGGSYNGSFSTAHVRLSDSSSGATRDIAFIGTHFEQMAVDTPAVLFVDGGSQGFFGIEFGGGYEFSSGTANWRGVTLARCNYVKFGAGVFVDGSAARAGYGIHVDSNSRSVRIGGECNFQGFLDSLTITGAADNGSGLIRITSTTHGLQTGDRVVISSVGGTTEANAMWVVTAIDADTFDLQGSTFSSAYTSGGTAKLLNAIELQTTAARAHVQLEPETIALTTPRTLTSYNATSKSTFSELTVNMSTEFTDFISTSAPQTLLWPKAYDTHVRANDSGSSAAAAGACRVLVKRPGSNQIAGITLSLSGVTNDEIRGNSGLVGANDDGNIGVTVTATGSNTLDLGIGVNGIRQ